MKGDVLFAPNMLHLTCSASYITFITISSESNVKGVSQCLHICLHINSLHVFKHREEHNSRSYTMLHTACST